MATASEAARIADESSWQDRVEYYRLAAAIDVMSENPTTPNHAERVVYAKLIIGGGDNIQGYSLGVATNDTILTTLDEATGAPDWGVTDNDIEFTVNSLFNAYAGVST